MPDKTIPPFAAIQATPPLSRGEEDANFKVVQDYLERFGYLRPTAFTVGQVDDPTSEALARFQEFYGLPETGEFDEATRAQMTTHRCGMPDLVDGVAFSTRCAWDHPNLTVALEDGTNDVGGSAEFQAVRNALATWATAAPLRFTETGTGQNPDIVVDWRPANDPDHSMVGGVLAHADFPPACGVVTSSLPKPVHFDDSEHLWATGAASGAFDVETVALHEFGHILGLQHSNVAGSVMFPSVSSNTTKRALTADDLGGITELYPRSVLVAGTYTMRQKSSQRFLDAHEVAARDFRLVTRPPQDNDTQRWLLQPIGTVYVIRQKSSGRFLDAHEASARDFRLVTRTAQRNATQRWVLMPSTAGSVTIRQLSNGRFVDAHESASKDFGLVTRKLQENDTQRWIMTQTSANTFTLRQKSNGRFVDAHESDNQDFAVVTRDEQGNDTQRWIVLPVDDGSFTVQQLSNRRFLDAHESDNEDFSVVTRTLQNNDTQRWLIERV